MAKKAWTYRDGGSYGLNSYGKPALVLQTLEGLLGEETMVKVLRTYARRYRFAHPTTEDFIATVDEVTGGRTGAGSSTRPSSRRTCATTRSR